MLRHLIKLIWNKKKQNFLLIAEIFISFIGLFAGFTFALYPYNNYKIPVGLEVENVWSIKLDAANKIENIDSLKIFRESIRKSLMSVNGVQDVTYSSSNIPFSGNSFNAGIKAGSMDAWTNVYTVENNYNTVLGMKMQEGRWFANQDLVAKDRPVVITETLKKKLFGDEAGIGKMIETDVTGRAKIVGIMSDFKHESEFEVPAPGLFLQIDTGNMRHNISILVKVKPDADASLESRVYKNLSAAVKNADIEIEHVADIMSAKNRSLLVPIIVFAVITGFLLINVALGIFGVFWYSISKRKGEIGLRRAVGATGNAISWQLMAEAFILCTLALILGLFFAIQFPLLKVFDLPTANYVLAIILSVIFIYALVIVCAIYPGKQAAAIYPAIALHED